MTSRAVSPNMQAKGGVARTALLIILGPEAVFFGTLLMVYLSLRTDQAARPFAGAAATHLIVPVANTVILLLSAVAAWRTLIAIRAGNTSQLRTGLVITLALGLVFVAGQVFEFSRSGMQPNDPTFGGIFLALIGFHALHVLAGMTILGINLGRARLGDFSADDHVAVQIGMWFWYFVVVVWLALFVALYVV